MLPGRWNWHSLRAGDLEQAVRLALCFGRCCCCCLPCSPHTCTSLPLYSPCTFLFTVTAAAPPPRVETFAAPWPRLILINLFLEFFDASASPPIARPALHTLPGKPSSENPPIPHIFTRQQNTYRDPNTCLGEYRIFSLPPCKMRLRPQCYLGGRVKPLAAVRCLTFCKVRQNHINAEPG